MFDITGHQRKAHHRGKIMLSLSLTDFRALFKKYKTFSVLIYSYINTSGNWKNEKLCGNTTPAGRSVFTQFRVFPIFTSARNISDTFNRLPYHQVSHRYVVLKAVAGKIL